MYKKGDSWTEELGFSKSEFKTAFEKIGITYKSKKEFTKALNEKNLFKGKFYCCYIDRIKNITIYYRNHKLLDLELEKLLNSVSEESSSPYVKKVTFDITENTTEKETTDRENKNNNQFRTGKSP